jgi:hypothetical protein
MADDFQQQASDDGVVPDPVSAPLPQDDHPFSEPDDLPPSDNQTLSDTHPATDTNIQVEEEYDEGLSGAAEAAEPNSNNQVKGYNPDTKKTGN